MTSHPAPAKHRKIRPRLVLCATLWSLEEHPARRHSWSIPRKLRAISEAGFDGLSAPANPAELRPLLDKHGLVLLGGMLARTAEDAIRQLPAQCAGGARLVNVMLGHHDTSPKEGARMARRVIRAGNDLGLAVHIETHRDTATETPEKFTELADRYAQAAGALLPVTWDHSHIAVNKHLNPRTQSDRLLPREWQRLIQFSQLFHCRPFNAQHCQIPVTNGRGRLTPEFEDYLIFLRKLFRIWLDKNQYQKELWICPELGTSVGYNISTNPPVWPDTLRCRAETLKIWYNETL